MRVTGNNDPERRARRTKRMKLHKIWHGRGGEREGGGGGEQSFFVEIPCLQNWRIEIQKERSSTTCFAPLRVNIHRHKNIHDHSEARKIEGIPMDGKLQWTLERGPLDRIETRREKQNYEASIVDIIFVPDRRIGEF